MQLTNFQDGHNVYYLYCICILLFYYYFIILLLFYLQFALPTGPGTVWSGTAQRLLQGQTKKFVLSKILWSKTWTKMRENKYFLFFYLWESEASKETR